MSICRDIQTDRQKDTHTDRHTDRKTHVTLLLLYIGSVMYVRYRTYVGWNYLLVQFFAKEENGHHPIYKSNSVTCVCVSVCHDKWTLEIGVAIFNLDKPITSKYLQCTCTYGRFFIFFNEP